MNTKKRTRTLTEGAIFIAIGFILSYLEISPGFLNGGAIGFAMLPIIFFSVRHGAKWGTLAGFIYGITQYIEGNGLAIDWKTIVLDYLVAYTLLGFGAGIFKNKVYIATVFGSFLRFIAHYFSGALIWGEWMPDNFLSMKMTSPWIYSALYNGAYILPCILLVCIMFYLLSLNTKMKNFILGKDRK
jgi:thiamine transporter